jgi:hypothetical protein
VRFLSSIEDRMPFRELAKNLDQIKISDSTGITKTKSETNMSENMYYLEVLVATHARKMVETNRWRSLVEFANCLSFPVAAWLRQEQFTLLLDTRSLFKELHNQFGLSFPSEISVVWCGVKMASKGHRRVSETTGPVRRRESEGSIGRRSLTRDSSGRRLSSRSSQSISPLEVESFEKMLWSKANMHEVELFFKMHRDSLVLIRFASRLK